MLESGVLLPEMESVPAVDEWLNAKTHLHAHSCHPNGPSAYVMMTLGFYLKIILILCARYCFLKHLDPLVQQ